MQASSVAVFIRSKVNVSEVRKKDFWKDLSIQLIRRLLNIVMQFKLVLKTTFCFYAYVMYLFVYR